MTEINLLGNTNDEPEQSKETEPPLNVNAVSEGSADQQNPKPVAQTAPSPNGANENDTGVTVGSENPTESVEDSAPTTESPAPATPATTVQSTGVQVTSAATQQAMNDYDAVTDALLNSIGDIGESSNLKMLIYGDPGTMKSSLLGTAPNNLIYDFEDGLIAAKTAVHHTGRPLAPNVKALPYKSMFQAEAIVKRLAAKDPAFAWVEVFSIDTVSSMHKRTIEMVTEREWAKRPSTRNKYKTETEEYAEVNEILTRYVRSLADLDRNLIILAHAQTVTPKNRPDKTYPDFSEKLANKLEAMMDIVGYMFKMEVDDGQGGKKIVPVLRVNGDETIHCKSRIPLPDLIQDPTYEQLKFAWEQAKESGTLAEA